MRAPQLRRGGGMSGRPSPSGRWFLSETSPMRSARHAGRGSGASHRVPHGQRRYRAARPAIAKAPLELLLRRGGKFRRAARRDLIAGVQRVQLRHVTMAGVGFIEILRPLLNLAILADADRRKAFARRRNLLAEPGIGAE